MSLHYIVFFCKQKTSYEMRISDWSSDVCSSDLRLVVSWPGLGEIVWERRSELFGAIESVRKPESKVWRSVIWGEIARHRKGDQLTLDQTGRASCRDRVVHYG